MEGASQKERLCPMEGQSLSIYTRQILTLCVYIILNGMVIFMSFNNSQSVNWACWFDVVELPCAFALSFYPDGIIEAVYIHGFVFAFEYIGGFGRPVGLYRL